MIITVSSIYSKMQKEIIAFIDQIEGKKKSHCCHPPIPTVEEFSSD
jgi:hypothetical protein